MLSKSQRSSERKTPDRKTPERKPSLEQQETVGENLPDAITAADASVATAAIAATARTIDDDPMPANDVVAAQDKPSSPQLIPAEAEPSAVAIKEEQLDRDESEHIDVGNEFKMDSEMVDVETTDRKVSIKPDLDAIIVESGMEKWLIGPIGNWCYCRAFFSFEYDISL